MFSLLKSFRAWRNEFFYEELTCSTCGVVQRKAVDWSYQKCKKCNDYLYDERY